ncbi:PAS domain-containing protein [Pseudomonas typographi]|uniref:PAS domain-containing protein n=1 Tax=Pseudomonas typographi TaxID=2715964 RepID=UPI0016895509|nr:PAS domain-containing protein [Pseudomonas typographi]MBD1551468.1 PAS domain-containing protein [Pseudomonas typographi]
MAESDEGPYARLVFSKNRSYAEAYALQKAMLDATPDCIKVLSVGGQLLMMNKAGCLALNVPEDSEFGLPWLPLLAQDVHPQAMEALQQAGQGRTARFFGKSLSPAGVRYWDNLLTPITDAGGAVSSILCVSRDVTAKTRLETELQEAIEREKLLSREMQHRIKNVFSVVSGLIYIAEKEAAEVSAAHTATHILRQKLGALARASDAAFMGGDSQGGQPSEVDLQAVVGSVLQPYGDRCALAGNPVSIGGNTLTTLALFLHELATNSIKYGALSADEGNVRVRWAASGEALTITWMETGGPPISGSPGRLGFGSDMVDRIVRSAGGSIQRTWRTEGLVADLMLPASTVG